MFKNLGLIRFSKNKLINKFLNLTIFSTFAISSKRFGFGDRVNNIKQFIVEIKVKSSLENKNLLIAHRINEVKFFRSC